MTTDPTTDRLKAATGPDQEELDRFYWEHGKCCAGCDHWRSLNSMAGECLKAAPMSGLERIALLGMSGCSLAIGAGYPFTNRDHLCGDFRDDFDWRSLPVGYLARIMTREQRAGLGAVAIGLADVARPRDEG